MKRHDFYKYRPHYRNYSCCYICAANPVTGKMQIMLMSEPMKYSRVWHDSVISTFGEYKNDKLLSFLQAKTNEMGLISHRPKLQYHIKILDPPVVNAFAVPGGYIYFTRGILAQLNKKSTYRCYRT